MLTEEQFKLDLSPHAKVYWLEDVKAVRVEWLDLFMGLKDFKSIAEKAIHVLNEEKGTIWIADSSESDGVFSSQIQDYIANELVPMAQAVGITDILTILPPDAGLASMTTKNWQARVRKVGNFNMEDFADLVSCKKWILSEG